MPGRHQFQAPRRRGGLRWIVAAAGLAAAGATVLGLSAAGSAAAAPPTPTYHAGSDTATFTVLGVVDGNCQVSTGGTEVWIKPGDTITFDSSLVGINVAGLPLHLGSLAGLNVSAQIDAGTSHSQSLSVVGSGSVAFPGAGQSALAAGDHTLTWTATGIPLVGGAITLPLSSSALQAGASLSWSGVIHVTTNAPQCKLAVGVPKTVVSVGPVKVTVPPVNVALPGVTLPTNLPSLPNLNPGGSGKTGQAPKPASGSTGRIVPEIPVPAKVVPQGSGDAVFGNIPAAADPGSLPQAQAGKLSQLLPVSGAGAKPGNTAARQDSTGKHKTIDLAAGRAASSQIPVILAVLAMIALVLVAGTYARLFLLRRN